MKTTLDELQALVCVVDAGSLSAAAEHMGQTASGVSRALARLEKKLATTLLRRTTRRLELTEEGAAFLAQARRILADVEAAEEQLARRHQQPAGRLRVDAASPFVLHVLAPLTTAFAERYPQVELELTSSERFIDLIEQRTDVAIRIGTLSDSSLHARPLARSRVRVLAAPEYLARHGVPSDVEALREHRLLGFTQPESLNRWPLRHALGEDLEIAPAVRASSGETLRAMALAGAGIVCLSDFMVEADLREGTLVELLAEHTRESLQSIQAVYYRNSALAARIACFLDFLAAYLETCRWNARR